MTWHHTVNNQESVARLGDTLNKIGFCRFWSVIYKSNKLFCDNFYLTSPNRLGDVVESHGYTFSTFRDFSKGYPVPKDFERCRKEDAIELYIVLFDIG